MSGPPLAPVGLEAGRAWDAVFVDRDGTLTVAPPPGEYVLHPDELRLLPGAASAVGRLNRCGVPVFVVTNQRCVSRGLLSPDGLAAIHQRLRELLAGQGAVVEQVLVCPHGEDSCDCRKPKDGLIRRVFEGHPQFRPRRCAVVGDSCSDVQAGTRLGLYRVLLATTPDVDGLLGGPVGPAADACVATLAAAVDLLLAADEGTGCGRTVKPNTANGGAAVR